MKKSSLFYNPQLMADEAAVRLFCLSNPEKFASFEDHEAALFIRLHELIEQAIKQALPVTILIEIHLGMTYNGGHSAEDIATWLWNTEHTTYARHHLKDQWEAMNPEIEEDSLLYGGMSSGDVRAVYSTITLETYLEALAHLYAA